MKKNIMLVLTLILVSVITFSACGRNTGLKHNPSVSESVVGNGGISVQKGDYLYFVNGTLTLDNYKHTDNDWGKTSYGALYRTKIVNGQIENDEDGFTENVELVVPKMVGHPNASFYILGNHIYYSTPNNKTNKSGKPLPNITDFFRVNINGTKNKLLYTSTSEGLTANDWTAYSNKNNHYLIIKDGDKLVSLHNNSVKEIANNVLSVAFYKQDRLISNDQKIVPFMNDYVYYTRLITEDDDLKGATGNILARTPINSKNEKILSQQNDVNYNLITVDNSSLYYTKGEQPYNVLYRSTLSENGNYVLNREVQLTNNTYESIYVLKNITSHITNHIVVEKDGAIYLINQTENSQVSGATPLVSANAKILAIYEDLIIYQNTSANTLHTINAKATNPLSTIKQINTDGKSFNTNSNNMFDFDGLNLYLYASYTSATSDAGSNYYMNRINLVDNKTEFVGKFKNNHLPEKPDNSELPEEEHVKWIN